MATAAVILSGTILAAGLLTTPTPVYAMEDSHPCSIETCTQGGVELIGPGPGDPSLNGIPEPSKGDSGQQKAADKKGENADKKGKQQQASNAPRAPVGPVVRANSDPVRKRGCGPFGKASANCP